MSHRCPAVPIVHYEKTDLHHLRLQMHLLELMQKGVRYFPMVVPHGDDPFYHQDPEHLQYGKLN